MRRVANVAPLPDMDVTTEDVMQIRRACDRELKRMGKSTEGFQFGFTNISHKQRANISLERWLDAQYLRHVERSA